MNRKINKRQLKLYNNLLAISNNSRKDNAFYYTDQDVISEDNSEKYKGWKYRIFLYEIASYNDWLINEDTFWSRGTMFLLNEKNEVQELVCLPMKKFFNLNENPLSMVSERLLNEEIVVTEKRDGSLMSTYIDVDYKLKLKSKGSTKSKHCEEAMKLLNTEKYCNLKIYLNMLANIGYTVDLEWTSPNNRIVIGYDSDELHILSIQNMFAVRNDTIDIFNVFTDSFANSFVIKQLNKSVLNTVSTDQGIEGYVVEFNDGQRIKMKTDQYCLLHKTKDSISTPKSLYEICLKKSSDDLKAMFIGDNVTIKQIEEMERKASIDFNTIKQECNSFYETNKHLDRKNYAIKNRETFQDGRFSLCMNLYLQKECDYIKVLIDNFI